MTRGREYGVLNRRGGEGGEMGEAEVGEPHATPSTRAPRDGLRGCITCLLPDHKPPTKTLMSNVNGDNATRSPSAIYSLRIGVLKMSKRYPVSKRV